MHGPANLPFLNGFAKSHFEIHRAMLKQKTLEKIPGSINPYFKRFMPPF